MDKRQSDDVGRSYGWLTGFLIACLLAALPVAVWLDLTSLAEAVLRRQATDLNSVITSVRGDTMPPMSYGACWLLPAQRPVVHNYETILGLFRSRQPCRWSLGKVVSEQQQNITYRFISDFPFKDRPAPPLDDFRTGSDSVPPQ